ncbi:MAG: O-methyltransferase [Bacteroidales bacterium]
MYFFKKCIIHTSYVLKYFKYLLTARWNGHGIHSPFIFSFYRSVLKPPINEPDKVRLKNVISGYKKDESLIHCPLFGAGSVYKASNEVKVKNFIKHSSVNAWTGKVLYNIAGYFKQGNILELGTGLGLSTIYMAMGNPGCIIKTVEGCQEKLEYAKKKFKEEGFKNIQARNGEFGEELPKILDEIQHLDLVFIDGNHNYSSTLNYFNMITLNCHNDSIVILDDIHWSPGMESAWEQIKQHSEVRVTIDLFRLGIVFFKKELSKENFVIKF